MLIIDKNKSVRESLLELHRAVNAYNTIYASAPSIRITFFFGLYTWAKTLNGELDDNLENLKKGICKEVLNFDYSLNNRDHWLYDRMKRDVENYGDILLMDCGIKPIMSNEDTFSDLYNLYETEIFKMLAFLEEAKNLLNDVHLFSNLITEIREQHSDPHFAIDFEKWRDNQIDYNFQCMFEMQVQAYVEFLDSGALSEAESPSYGDIDAVDEEKLHKLLSPDKKKPEQLKYLWAKLKKFIEVKENVLIIPKNECIRKYIIKHIDNITSEHFRALFRLNYLTKRIHEDMVKERPELKKYLDTNDDSDIFGIMNALTRMCQQQWFKDRRTDKKYDDAWIGSFFSALLHSEHRATLLELWQDADKRQTLKGVIIGCLKNAGVIDDSDLKIAKDYINGSFRENKTFSTYIGRCNRREYKGIKTWISDYVAH